MPQSDLSKLDLDQLDDVQYRREIRRALITISCAMGVILLICALLFIFRWRLFDNPWLIM
jgi:hypothetical protein